jgi:thioredoxin-like negative regulator of GroEL
MSKQIISEIPNRETFYHLLSNNPGLIVIKLGAEWCGPCKKIEPFVNHCFSQMTKNVQCCIIDVDDNFQVYSFLKTKKMVNGIPVILCYNQGNLNYIPDDIVTGSDQNQVNAFFIRCFQKMQETQRSVQQQHEISS